MRWIEIGKQLEPIQYSALLFGSCLVIGHARFPSLTGNSIFYFKVKMVLDVGQNASNYTENKLWLPAAQIFLLPLPD